MGGDVRIWWLDVGRRVVLRCGDVRGWGRGFEGMFGYGMVWNGMEWKCVCEMYVSKVCRIGR